jgi:hypothetical protein
MKTGTKGRCHFGELNLNRVILKMDLKEVGCEREYGLHSSGSGECSVVLGFTKYEVSLE